LNLSIAIPDSSLADESTILYKTKKISMIARACAIFKINQIFIYQDGKQNKNDLALLSTSLKLFPKTQLLKYAGALQPLNISSHLTTSDQKMIKIGDIRDALIINYKGKKFLDIGINKLIQYFGKMKSGTRIAIQIKTTQPELTVKEISRKDIKDYWGYSVKERANLLSILSTWKGKIILTSKKGKNFTILDAKKSLERRIREFMIF